MAITIGQRIGSYTGGLETAGSSRCIVMELVEGETLQERIVQGPIPVEDVLSIARRIAC